MKNMVNSTESNEIAVFWNLLKDITDICIRNFVAMILINFVVKLWLKCHLFSQYVFIYLNNKAFV